MRRAAGRRSTRSSASCAASPTTRRCSSSRGKPVGVFRTHEWAPRVLIANSNLVGKWATWDVFRELERAGLMMYGQMTAGSWIYIGTQGILQGTYETFAEPARQHFGGTLRGRVVLTAGLGGMGGAQPLAVTMNDGVALAIEVDEARAPAATRDRLRRPADARSGDEALAWARAAAAAGEAALDRAGRQRRRDRARLGRRPASGSTSSPTRRPRTTRSAGTSPPRSRSPTPRDAARAAARRLRRAGRCASMADHVRAMLAFQAAGAVVFDYGNNLRAQAQEAGVADAFDYPGFVPAFIRPQFCEGRGPFRWAALSGDPGGHPADGPGGPRALPGGRRPAPLDRDGPGAGSRSRACRPGSAGSATASGRRPGWRSTSWSGPARSARPIVIGRDHLDAGSVASPNRETEAMRDGSDAIADWPLLNALVNTAAGATWVSIHHGGGVGIGYSQHAGMVVVADGTDARGPEARAGPDDGPGDGRPPPRRRGLRARDRGRPGARRPRPDARGPS